MARRGHVAPPEQGLLFGASPAPHTGPGEPPAPVWVPGVLSAPAAPDGPGKVPPGARSVYLGDKGEVVLSPCGRCGAVKAVICGRELIEPGSTRDLCVPCVEATVRPRVRAGESVPYGFEWVDCT